MPLGPGANPGSPSAPLRLPPMSRRYPAPGWPSPTTWLRESRLGGHGWEGGWKGGRGARGGGGTKGSHAWGGVGRWGTPGGLEGGEAKVGKRHRRRGAGERVKGGGGARGGGGALKGATGERDAWGDTKGGTNGGIAPSPLPCEQPARGLRVLRPLPQGANPIPIPTPHLPREQPRGGAGGEGGPK